METDTPNPKPWGKQRETSPAKIFPRHDMSKGNGTVGKNGKSCIAVGPDTRTVGTLSDG